MVFQRMAEGEMRAMEKEDILALLKRTGLSDYEAKASLAMVLRSHGTAEDVADTADIPRTSAYKVLDALKQKGLDEGVSTRMLIYAGVLIRDGMSAVESSEMTMIRPLTDDPDMATAIRSFVLAQFG